MSNKKILRIPTLAAADQGSGTFQIVQESLLNPEETPSKFIKLFEEKKVGIEYWF